MTKSILLQLANGSELPDDLDPGAELKVSAIGDDGKEVGPIFTLTVVSGDGFCFKATTSERLPDDLRRGTFNYEFGPRGMAHIPHEMYRDSEADDGGDHIDFVNGYNFF